MLHLLNRIYARLRSDGFRRTCQRARDRWRDLWDECRLGIYSAPYVKAAELGIDDPAYHDCQPTDFPNLWRTLDSLPIVADQDVLLDYGAGMGRMMVAAAMYPLRKVIGIELSPQLSAIAEENIARLRGRMCCPDVELITTDACDYAVPPDVTIIYIFNSFSGRVLAEVLDRIRDSLQESPRKVTLVFCAPPELRGDPLGGRDWLTPPRIVAGARDRTIYFYETLPVHSRLCTVEAAA